MDQHTATIRYIADNDQVELSLSPYMSKKELNDIVCYLKDEERKISHIFRYGYSFENITIKKTRSDGIDHIIFDLVYGDTYDFDIHQDMMIIIKNVIENIPYTYANIKVSIPYIKI